MLNTLRRLIQRYGFFKREWEPACLTEREKDAYRGQWHDAGFYTEEKRRNERLAQIARERDALKLALTKAKRDKKAVSPIYIKLRALSVEELNLEAGK